MPQRTIRDFPEDFTALSFVFSTKLRYIYGKMKTKNKNQPNILLIMTDQQRGDCLGIDGHPAVQTPYLDAIGTSGFHFRRAYTTCPVSVPARRTIMTGRKPASHGVFMNYHTHLDGPTLPGVLSDAGYQTHLVGKLHLWPERKLYGFNSADWADSPVTYQRDNDYARYLRREGVHLPDAGMTHGSNNNGAPVRPWDMPEHLHFTNWCATKALEFLERRDPTVPFFLKVSFHQPHQPHCPPEVYYKRYMDMDLPEPVVGDWARIWDEPQRGLPVCPWRYWPTKQVMKQLRAAYFGCVNHIDDQIGRILNVMPQNTIVIFTSDHGEMLGDHQWFRKRNAFEPSARIPFVMKLPDNSGMEANRAVDELITLEDVMPTLLDAAGVEGPEGMDGRSLIPLLRGQSQWRDYVHGECSEVPTAGTGQQYITDERWKYIWYPGTGQEQLFDLRSDVEELHDLASNPAYNEELKRLRSILVKELEGRPEGFVQDSQLQCLGGPTQPFLEEYRKC